MAEFQFRVDPAIFDRPVEYTSEERVNLLTLDTCIDKLKEKGLESSVECLVQYQAAIWNEAWDRCYPNTLETLSPENGAMMDQYLGGRRMKEWELPANAQGVLEKLRSGFSSWYIRGSLDREGTIIGETTRGWKVLVARWGPPGKTLPTFDQMREILTVRKRLSEVPMYGVIVAIVGFLILLYASCFAPKPMPEQQVLMWVLSSVAMMAFGLIGAPPLWRREQRKRFAEMHPRIAWAL